MKNIFTFFEVCDLQRFSSPNYKHNDNVDNHSLKIDFLFLCCVCLFNILIQLSLLIAITRKPGSFLDTSCTLFMQSSPPADLLPK